MIDDIYLNHGSPESLISFFFCQYDNIKSLSARTILGSLARQCFPYDPTSSHIEKALCALFDNNNPDTEEVESFFITISEKSRKHFIIIDGLDECQESERVIVLRAIKKLLNLRLPRIKVFISAREEISTEVERTLNVQHKQSMSCKQVEEDIKIAVNAILQDKCQHGKLSLGNPDLLPRIETALIKGARGM